MSRNRARSVIAAVVTLGLAGAFVSWAASDSQETDLKPERGQSAGDEGAVMAYPTDYNPETSTPMGTHAPIPTAGPPPTAYDAPWAEMTAVELGDFMREGYEEARHPLYQGPFTTTYAVDLGPEHAETFNLAEEDLTPGRISAVVTQGRFVDYLGGGGVFPYQLVVFDRLRGGKLRMLSDDAESLLELLP